MAPLLSGNAQASGEALHLVFGVPHDCCLTEHLRMLSHLNFTNTSRYTMSCSVPLQLRSARDSSGDRTVGAPEMLPEGAAAVLTEISGCQSCINVLTNHEAY